MFKRIFRNITLNKFTWPKQRNLCIKENESKKLLCKVLNKTEVRTWWENYWPSMLQSFWINDHLTKVFFSPFHRHSTKATEMKTRKMPKGKSTCSLSIWKSTRNFFFSISKQHASDQMWISHTLKVGLDDKSFCENPYGNWEYELFLKEISFLKYAWSSAKMKES